MTNGLALLPLVWADNKPGHEIEFPLALVILGGLTTSTVLNLLLLPRYNCDSADRNPELNRSGATLRSGWNHSGRIAHRLRGVVIECRYGACCVPVFRDQDGKQPKSNLERYLNHQVEIIRRR